MDFVSGVTWRSSQRGLVVCGAGGSSLLIEHERAAELPALLGDASDADELAALLGGADADRRVVADLVAERIVADPTKPVHQLPVQAARRVVFTRSGVEFTGIDGVARVVHRFVMPVLQSWLGRIAIGVVVVAGVIALIVGRPDGSPVSGHPWVDATVGMIVGFGLAALHELAHAVALVHYGRTPRSAGCGFYWGALCFYVDSSDGTTLPRRARIINALTGLAVDVVTMSVLLLVSHACAASVLVMSVCWRLAIMQLIGVVENGLPILEVDGHVALADYLDEPDLSPRSREALSRRLRGVRRHERPWWLAAYGAFSLTGGIVLLVMSTWVWWLAAGDMIKALLGGNPVEMLLGLYVVVPVALAALFSAVGLAVEFAAKPTVVEQDHEQTAATATDGR
jgi:hypothetical protein